MIRIVVQHAPNLYALGLVEEAAVTPTFEHGGTTYYKAETHDHWVLYKPALSGWGAAAPDPSDPRPTFDANQR